MCLFKAFDNRGLEYKKSFVLLKVYIVYGFVMINDLLMSLKGKYFHLLK